MRWRAPLDPSERRTTCRSSPSPRTSRCTRRPPSRPVRRRRRPLRVGVPALASRVGARREGRAPEGCRRPVQDADRAAASSAQGAASGLAERGLRPDGRATTSRRQVAEGRASPASGRSSSCPSWSTIPRTPSTPPPAQGDPARRSSFCRASPRRGNTTAAAPDTVRDGARRSRGSSSQHAAGRPKVVRQDHLTVLLRRFGHLLRLALRAPSPTSGARWSPRISPGRRRTPRRRRNGPRAAILDDARQHRENW